MKFKLSKGQWEKIGKTAGWFGGGTWGDATSEATTFIYRYRQNWKKLPTFEEVVEHLRSKKFRESSIASAAQSALNGQSAIHGTPQ